MAPFYIDLPPRRPALGERNVNLPPRTPTRKLDNEDVDQDINWNITTDIPSLLAYPRIGAHSTQYR
jgi:hypothetical protein